MARKVREVEGAVTLGPYGAAARGLSRYVRDVCRELRVGPEASCWELEDRATAYVAVDGRLPGYPHHDLALTWDEENGWAAALETRCGDDMIILSYLGGDVLPPPGAVADFIAELRADEYPGQPDPPALRAAFADDGFDARLGALMNRPGQPLTGV